MKRYFKRGFIFGFLATLSMSIVVIVVREAAIVPVIQSVMGVVIQKLFGELDTPKLIIISLFVHALYGSLMGALFYSAVKESGNMKKSILFGLFIWFILQLVIFPLLGWGVFGYLISNYISFTSLIMHLIYGGVLGMGFKTMNLEDYP
jgi:hypothetical protein